MAFSWAANAATSGLVSSLTSGPFTTISGTEAIAIVAQQGYPSLTVNGWSDSYSNAWVPIPVFSGVASASGSTLTVISINAGQLFLGSIIAGAGVPTGAIITALGTGSGFTGTYTISTSTSFASTTITTNALVGSTNLALASYFFFCPAFSGGSGNTFEATLAGGTEIMSFVVAGFTGRSGILGSQAAYVDNGFNITHPGVSVTAPVNADVVSPNALVDATVSNPSNLFTAGSGWTIPTNGTNVGGGFSNSVPTMLQYRASVLAGSYMGGYTTLNYDRSTGFVIVLPAAAGPMTAAIHGRRRRRPVVTTYYRR